MARKHRNGPQPGNDDYVPLTDAQRRAHADALSHAHAGHQCAERAASLCQAGEYYALLGDHNQAEQVFREALDIAAAEPASVHASYAAFLLDQHRHDEALALIAAARRLHPQDPDVFDLIGEALEEHHYFQQAARWFTAGLVAILGHLTDLQIDDLHDDFDITILANGRYRARQALGLPPDHIDNLVQQLRQTSTTPQGRN